MNVYLGSVCKGCRFDILGLSLIHIFEEGNQFETLVGVTGSGKTFTMANIIQNVQKPTPVSYTHL